MIKLKSECQISERLNYLFKTRLVYTIGPDLISQTPIGSAYSAEYSKSDPGLRKEIR